MSVEHMPLTNGPRHRWNAIDVKRIPACDTADGNERTERTCAYCGIIKVTVHPVQGFAWREWRTKAGAKWQAEYTPRCVAVGDAAQVPFQ
jgi:2-polyprenyl-6-methoxyphenol hydroxylase-like FAD-dependent oxidoreductase